MRHSCWQHPGEVAAGKGSQHSPSPPLGTAVWAWGEGMSVEEGELAGCPVAVIQEREMLWGVTAHYGASMWGLG